MALTERKKRRGLSLVGICSILLLAFSPPFQQLASFPNEIRLFEGSAKKFSLSIPATATVTTDHPGIITVNGKPDGTVRLDEGNLTLVPNRTGEANVQIKVGHVPVKSVKVHVLPERLLYPGGQSIGVQLHSAGILVVGHKMVEDRNGIRSSPAENADIRIGDLIVRINDQMIKEAGDLSRIIHKAGKNGQSLNIELLRGKEKVNVMVDPVLDKEDQQFKLGLYVRDSAAGVGTMTFYDPDSRIYGALGHVISDLDTQKPIVVGDGAIVPSKVTAIDRGEQGKPGSIRAVFPNEQEQWGNIEKNTPFGIYGKLKKNLSHPIYKEPLPIALVEEVKEGPAEILTVVEEDKVERFSIEIVNVIKQRYPSTKGMIIRVTDPRLLGKTGGIVQGMSGSPIIQDGKIVGAVTHVFVNDPTQGYGCFIEWMLQEAGLQPEQKAGLKAS